MNYEIKVPMIRVIDDEGKMLGVFQVADAVKMAYEKGLDLIEIAPEANPPTCKMMDFGKYKYQLKKKAAERCHSPRCQRRKPARSRKSTRKCVTQPESVCDNAPQHAQRDSNVRHRFRNIGRNAW